MTSRSLAIIDGLPIVEGIDTVIFQQRIYLDLFQQRLYLFHDICGLCIMLVNLASVFFHNG